MSEPSKAASFSIRNRQSDGFMHGRPREVASMSGLCYFFPESGFVRMLLSDLFL